MRERIGPVSVSGLLVIVMVVQGGVERKVVANTLISHFPQIIMAIMRVLQGGGEWKTLLKQ